MPGITTLSQPL